jgi:hypothetical protein
MPTTPQIRALIKVAMFLVSIMIVSLAAVYASLLLGPGTVMIAFGLVLLAVFTKLFYDSAVSEEQYRDTLRSLQSTIKDTNDQT